MHWSMQRKLEKKAIGKVSLTTTEETLDISSQLTAYNDWSTDGTTTVSATGSATADIPTSLSVDYVVASDANNNAPAE